MAAEYYPEWLARPLWQRAWCWLAYWIFILTPLSRRDGLYNRFSMWLLSWAGCYANREINHPVTE